MHAKTSNRFPVNQTLIAIFFALFCTEVHAMNRRIVLCLDGTWNNPYDEQERVDRTITTEPGVPLKVIKPSNPLKVCRAVLPIDSDGREQITYYHAGVGSLSKYPGIANELLHLDDRALGGVWGAGFEANIEEGLHFLVVNYEPGDDVFIFGFSRGAATARGVTRFLEWNHGLPVKDDAYFLPQFFQAFVSARGDPEMFDRTYRRINNDLALMHKPPMQSFRPVTVTYLGVWDTVMALGSRFAAIGKSTAEPGWTFYAGSSPARCVLHAQQALAIDERRFDFRPEIWTHAEPNQTMAQRWFIGAHSNVGGGYMHDGLANRALHWIVEGATTLGLQIDKEFLRHYGQGWDDTVYESYKWYYRLFDRLRGRTGKGIRRLIDRPATANLTLDRYVVERMRTDPTKLIPAHAGQRVPAYLPGNVLQFLACQKDLDAYLASIGITDLAAKPLPPDVVTAINQLRPLCSQQVAARLDRNAP
jgi:uncharacterized protein (DUF2235 family)